MCIMISILEEEVVKIGEEVGVDEGLTIEMGEPESSTVFMVVGAALGVMVTILSDTLRL